MSQWTRRNVQHMRLLIQERVSGARRGDAVPVDRLKWRPYGRIIRGSRISGTRSRLPVRPPRGSSEIRLLEVRRRLGSQAPRGTRVIRNGSPPRVIRTPATITAPPTMWLGRIGSPRNAAASSTASAGTRNWYAAVRVGPTTRIPFWTTTFETPAARNPEYRTAPRTPGGRGEG